MRKIVILLATMTGLFPNIARAESFSVTNERAPTEISEDSYLYINGNLAATFRLDDKKSSITKRIEIPNGQVNLTYAVCGRITVLNAEGRAETHQVSGEGSLTQPRNHHLVALTDEEFSNFFLQDPLDTSVAKRHPGKTEFCAFPLS